MAIAHDATTVDSSASSTTHTIQHTTTSDDSRFIVVGIYVGAGTASQITSVTYDGVALTDSGLDESYTGAESTLFYGLAPSSGTNDLVVTLSTADAIKVAISTYSNVRQTPDPVNGTGSNSGPSNETLDVSVTTTVDNSWVVGAFHGEGGDMSAGTNTTSRGVVDTVTMGCDTNAGQTPAGAHTIQGSQTSERIMGQAIGIAPVNIVTTSVSSALGYTDAIGSWYKVVLSSVSSALGLASAITTAIGRTFSIASTMTLTDVVSSIKESFANMTNQSKNNVTSNDFTNDDIDAN